MASAVGLTLRGTEPERLTASSDATNGARPRTAAVGGHRFDAGGRMRARAGRDQLAKYKALATGRGCRDALRAQGYCCGLTFEVTRPTRLGALPDGPTMTSDPSGKVPSLGGSGVDRGVRPQCCPLALTGATPTMRCRADRGARRASSALAVLRSRAAPAPHCSAQPDHRSHLC